MLLLKTLGAFISFYFNDDCFPPFLSLLLVSPFTLMTECGISSSQVPREGICLMGDSPMVETERKIWWIDGLSLQTKWPPPREGEHFKAIIKRNPSLYFIFFLLPTSLFLPIYTYSPSLSVTSKFNCELIGAREPARRGSHVNFFTTGTHSWADLYELGYCLGKIPWVQLIYTDEAHWKEFWLNESASGILPPTLPTGPCQKSFSSSSLSISPYGDHMDW